MQGGCVAILVKGRWCGKCWASFWRYGAHRWCPDDRGWRRLLDKLFLLLALVSLGSDLPAWLLCRRHHKRLTLTVACSCCCSSESCEVRASEISNCRLTPHTGRESSNPRRICGHSTRVAHCVRCEASQKHEAWSLLWHERTAGARLIFPSRNVRGTGKAHLGLSGRRGMAPRWA